MGPAHSKSRLSQSIAEILGTAEPMGSTAGTRPGPLRRSLIYSSMALLAVNPVAVNAVGLGELSVNSYLGQPLNATVPITLAAGESLPKNCVAPTRGNSGIAAPGNLRVSNPAVTKPGTYNLRVTTTNALHEPMYEISLLIDCPGTSLLLRQYVLMLDLPGMNVSTPVTSQVTTAGDVLTVPVTAVPSSSQPVSQAQTTAAVSKTTSVTNQPIERSLRSTGTSIPAGQPYRVSKGDSLSTIAARINGRAPDTTWSVANLIFANNSHAFIRNNPNLIKLGSLIDIPDVSQLAGLEKSRTPIVTATAANQATSTQNTPSESFSEPRPMPAPAPVAAPVNTSRPEVFVTQTAPKQPESTSLNIAEDPGVNTSADTFEPVTAESSVKATTASNETAFTSPFLDEIPAPPAEIDAPQIDTVPPKPVAESVDQPVPVVTTTTVTETAEADDSVNSLFAIFVGVLLGVFMSLLVLRRKLVDAVLGIIRRRTPATIVRSNVQAPTTSDADEDTADDLNDFETSEAESAFSTLQEETPQKAVPEELSIGTPAEDTYIVETSEAAPTEQIEPVTVIDPGSPDDVGKLSANPDEEMLAMLFNDSDQSSNNLDSKIFDPTGGLHTNRADSFAEPTVEMPEWDDEENIDPALDLTADFGDEFQQDEAELLLEQTAEMLLEDTAQLPGAAELEDDLDACSSGDEEDLSRSLQAAMELLEGDFDDEFTASQILERTEAAQSLDQEPPADDDSNTMTLNRKASS